ncbi:porin [Roseospirillum parvum]|uniref:Outer membrane protein (Porin) n=1 Tax=Roseospirillum parvum TaxID=83401 RepID=A0A1G8DU89_9PROT|nr:porin [Roseospirillum parvum]SDH61010.1 Outer membrane protein (porin) [Roseospirillum parvum]
MKKVLIGTTALVAATAMTTDVRAADPISITLGGYGNWYVGWAGNDDSYGDVARGNQGDEIEGHVWSDAEIHFNGSTTLDNGLTIGVHAEWEIGSYGTTDADPMDEAYVTIGSAYGQLLVGEENNRAYQMHVYGAPGLMLGMSESDIYALIERPGAVAGQTTTALNTDSDRQGINYTSPSFYGFQFGATYKPEGAETTGSVLNKAPNSIATDATSENIWAASLTYDGEFSGVGVAASAGYFSQESGNASVNEHDEWSAGLQLTYAGFSVGGSYRQLDITEDGTITPGANGGADFENAEDGYVWVAGVGYATGPYAVGFTYQATSAEGAFSNVPGNVNGGDDETAAWIVEGTYDMGAGVAVGASVFHVEYDDETTNFANNNEGWGFATGIMLSF